MDFIFYHVPLSDEIGSLPDVLIDCDYFSGQFSDAILSIPSSVYNYVKDHPDLNDFKFVLQLHKK